MQPIRLPIPSTQWVGTQPTSPQVGDSLPKKANEYVHPEVPTYSLRTPPHFLMSGFLRQIFWIRALQVRSQGVGPPPPPPCDIHVARCGEHLPPWGVFVMTAYWALIRPSGEDAMGRSCILDSPPPPPRQGDARGSADARSSTDACLS